MIEGNIIDGFKETLENYILNAVADVGHAYVILFSLFLSYVQSSTCKVFGQTDYACTHSLTLDPFSTRTTTILLSLSLQRFGGNDGKVGRNVRFYSRYCRLCHKRSLWTGLCLCRRLLHLLRRLCGNLPTTPGIAHPNFFLTFFISSLTCYAECPAGG
jgi:hypothetical protein